MVGRRRREREAAERLAAQRAAAEAAIQRRREAAKMDKERRRRLGTRRPWRKVGLSRRWADPLRKAEMALQHVVDARDAVARASEPGVAFAQAQRHLEETVRSVERGMARCQDIALAAGMLEASWRGLPKDRTEERERLAARLDDAQERIAQHLTAMQSAAIAARELVLQSSLTRHDEEAVLDIDSRLRGVSAVLDAEGA